ncbi:MAG TPA: carboxyl transferase domain-containing protein, partial [Acidimicrobiales bacterium]
MPALPTSIDPSSETFRANHRALEEAVAGVDEQLALARAGGGERYVARHRERGKLPAHERIELLLDRDTAFLELAPLAAWGTQFTVGASTILGIGVVEGVECLISASDPTVRGGAMNPWSFRKSARGADIALQNHLPVINLVE